MESIVVSMVRTVTLHVCLCLIDAKTVEREMQNARSIPSWGILGTVQLLSGPYLVSIRDATRVGRLLGHDVFRIVECALLPLADNAVMQSMSSAQVAI